MSFTTDHGTSTYLQILSGINKLLPDGEVDKRVLETRFNIDKTDLRLTLIAGIEGLPLPFGNDRSNLASLLAYAYESGEARLSLKDYETLLNERGLREIKQ